MCREIQQEIAVLKYPTSQRELEYIISLVRHANEKINNLYFKFFKRYAMEIIVITLLYLAVFYIIPVVLFYTSVNNYVLSNSLLSIICTVLFVIILYAFIL